MHAGSFYMNNKVKLSSTIWNLQTISFRIDVKKWITIQWLIHYTKQHKNNQSLHLKHRCILSQLGIYKHDTGAFHGNACVLWQLQMEICDYVDSQVAVSGTRLGVTSLHFTSYQAYTVL